MKGDKNEVELQPWKLNVNYLKATSHYAVNFLDTLSVSLSRDVNFYCITR